MSVQVIFSCDQPNCNKEVTMSIDVYSPYISTRLPKKWSIKLPFISKKSEQIDKKIYCPLHN